MRKLMLLSFLVLSNFSTAKPLTVPQLVLKDRLSQSYRCEDGSKLTVQYFNTQNGQSFALLTIKGKPLLMVSSVAASGVRYVADQYVWWTAKNEGQLYFNHQDDSPPILANCKTS